MISECKFILPIDELVNIKGINAYKNNELDYANKPSDVEDKLIEKILNEFSAKNISNLLFPTIKDKKYPHIFISHSSKDQNMATQFASYIYDKYKITSFIDSMLWAHIAPISKRLLREKVNVTSTGGFEINESIYALSHMNLILNQALMEAMDSADCVIFIASKSSLRDYNKDELLYNQKDTLSPWIASEIDFSNKLATKWHKDRRKHPFALSESTSIESFNINDARIMFELPHEIDFSDFKTIRSSGFTDCDAFRKCTSPIECLDVLYAKWLYSR